MDLKDLAALMGDSLETEEARDLWVIDVEAQNLAPLLGEARRMADSLGAYVHYIGGGNSEEAIAFGADRVHQLEFKSTDEVIAALTNFFNTHRPEFIFLPATGVGDEIAGRLAHQLNGGAIYNCLAIKLDESTRELTGTYPVYDNAYYLEVAVTAKPAIVTVQPDVLPIPYRDSSRSGEVAAIELTSNPSRVRALGAVEHPSTTVPLH